MSESPSRTPQGGDKFIVRLPDGLRDELKAVAMANHRSMNAELVARLQQSLSTDVPSPVETGASEVDKAVARAVAALRKEAITAIPVAVDLWDNQHISAYLKRSVDNVRKEIVTLPTFPAPVRLPVHGKAQALYKAREVIKWAESHATRRRVEPAD